MTTISVEKKNFPDGLNGESLVSYDTQALVRASVAAGRNPQHPAVSDPEKAELKSREYQVRSAVNIDKDLPSATEIYKGSRYTNRGHMSEAVGNAFCALTAYVDYKIPWLMNVEELNRYAAPLDISKSKNSGRKRADFIGRDGNGEWYVFEVKGRSSKPSDGKFKDWKKQARTIQTINGKQPLHHIVAATYLNEDDVWTQTLYDPPPDNKAFVLKFDERVFFSAYYRRLRDRLAFGDHKVNSEFGSLYSIGLPGVLLGVHIAFENAAFDGDIGRLLKLSESVMRGDGKVSTDDPDLHIFADGILIKTAFRD